MRASCAVPQSTTFARPVNWRSPPAETMPVSDDTWKQVPTWNTPESWYWRTPRNPTVPSTTTAGGATHNAIRRQRGWWCPVSEAIVVAPISRSTALSLEHDAGPTSARRSASRARDRGARTMPPAGRASSPWTRAALGCPATAVGLPAAHRRRPGTTSVRDCANACRTNAPSCCGGPDRSVDRSQPWRDCRGASPTSSGHIGDRAARRPRPTRHIASLVVCRATDPARYQACRMRLRPTRTLSRQPGPPPSACQGTAGRAHRGGYPGERTTSMSRGRPAQTNMGRGVAAELLDEFGVLANNAVAALDLCLAGGNPRRRLLVRSMSLLKEGGPLTGP